MFKDNRALVKTNVIFLLNSEQHFEVTRDTNDLGHPRLRCQATFHQFTNILLTAKNIYFQIHGK